MRRAAGAGAGPPLLEQVGALLRPWLVLALVCGGFSLREDFRETFWTAEYLPNILQQAATNIILAVGMTFVVLSGGIDLSVGSVLALCGVALGMTLQTGPPLFMAVGMAFPAGALAALAAARLLRRRHGPAAGAARRAAAPRAPLADEWVWLLAFLVAAAVTAGVGWLLHRGLAGGAGLGSALAATLLLGVAAGLLNGLFVSLGRVPSFVVTLGMFTAARGLALYATGGNSVGGLPAALGELGQGWPLVLIALAVVAGGALLQGRARAGRAIQAIGANEEATRLAGVPVLFYKTLAYVLSGLAAGVAAVALTAKFRLADTGAGTGAELDAIAAVVIGGTSLSGGRGSVVGSLVGALTIAVLRAGLVLTGVQDTLQGVIIGAVIVAAVMVDQLRRRR